MIELNKIYNEDCLVGMQRIPDGSVDLVATDCPYKITSGGNSTNEKWLKMQPHGCLDKRNGSASSDVVKSGKMFGDNEILFTDWLPIIYQKLKDDSHAYIMINSRNLKSLWEEAEEVGFMFQNLLIWDKGNATPNKYYMQAYECVLMLRKGHAKTINKVGTTNILRVPNVRNKQHPTEKPVELMAIMIDNSTNEQDTVLDPFMGSGTTAIACIREKRNFIGFEMDKEYYDKACKRIELERMQPSLF